MGTDEFNKSSEGSKLSLASPGIGGYAVILHGGDDLADWKEVAALCQLRNRADKLVQDWFGATTLQEAIMVRKARNHAYNQDRNSPRLAPEFYTSNEYGTVHALSPEIFRDAADKIQRGDIGRLTEEILDAQAAHYEVAGEKVVCSDDEWEAMREKQTQQPHTITQGRRLASPH